MAQHPFLTSMSAQPEDDVNRPALDKCPSLTLPFAGLCLLSLQQHRTGRRGPQVHSHHCSADCQRIGELLQWHLLTQHVPHVVPQTSMQQRPNSSCQWGSDCIAYRLLESLWVTPLSLQASASTGRRKILEDPPGSRRELLQGTTAAPEPPPPPASQQTLQQILSEVTALQSGQVALQSDITSLQTDVNAANEAAAVRDVAQPTHRKVLLPAMAAHVLAVQPLQMQLQLEAEPSYTRAQPLRGNAPQLHATLQARAEDSSLQALITQARNDIATGQAEVQALLTQIIGKQNQAAASAEQTAASLAAIQNLQAQQAQAQQDIANAVQDQITAIQVGLAASGVTCRLQQSGTRPQHSKRWLLQYVLGLPQGRPLAATKPSLPFLSAAAIAEMLVCLAAELTKAKRVQATAAGGCMPAIVWSLWCPQREPAQVLSS